MDFELLTDEDIIKELASRLEQYRLESELREIDVATNGGITIDVINRLKNGKNINLKNFLGILRGLGELNQLDALLKPVDSLNLHQKKNSSKKRVFKKDTNHEDDFQWGDGR